MNFRVVFLFLLFSLETFATVRILTFHCNQAEFIKFQYRSLQKFLTDDFELIVFNDAIQEEHEKEIESVCHEEGIPCIRFKPEWHLTDPLNVYLKNCLEDPSTVNRIWAWARFDVIEEIAQHPSVRHSHVIQYALDHYGYDHDDVIVIMDGDNFLIKPMSFRKLLETHDLVGCSRECDGRALYRKQSLPSAPQSSTHRWLPWVLFVAFNPSKLPHPKELQFHVDIISNHPNYPQHALADTGAAACRYIMKYPHLNIQEYTYLDSERLLSLYKPQELREMGFSDPLVQFMVETFPQHTQVFAFEHFLHYGSISFPGSAENPKLPAFKEFMSRILE